MVLTTERRSEPAALAEQAYCSLSSLSGDAGRKGYDSAGT